MPRRSQPNAFGRRIAASLAGGILAVLLVAGAGMLAVQIRGLRLGIVYAFDNTIVGITNPHQPPLQLLALPILCALVMYLIATVPWARSTNARRASIAVFSAVLALLIATAYITGSNRELSEQQERSRLIADSLVSTGWLGWLQEGGRNSAVQLVLILALLLLAATFQRKESPRLK